MACSGMLRSTERSDDARAGHAYGDISMRWRSKKAASTCPAKSKRDSFQSPLCSRIQHLDRADHAQRLHHCRGKRPRARPQLPIVTDSAKDSGDGADAFISVSQSSRGTTSSVTTSTSPAGDSMPPRQRTMFGCLNILLLLSAFCGRLVARSRLGVELEDRARRLVALSPRRTWSTPACRCTTAPGRPGCTGDPTRRYPSCYSLSPTIKVYNRREFCVPYSNVPCTSLVPG